MPSSTGDKPDWLARAAFGAYRFAGLCLMPLAPLALSRRARRGKEDPARLGERYGRASLPRPAGRLVWVHAASVGETNAILPLVDRIIAAGSAVVFTCVTVTAAKIAGARLPQGAVHQFSPLDVAPWIDRFLRHWRPDCALFVESELWPTTIMKLAAASVPQIMVNARMSERSFAGWRRSPRVARRLFSRIALCLAQSEKDGDRYRALGVQKVVFTGNLKFDVPPPPVDAKALAAFRESVGTRPLWIAASTHPGEEAIILAAHRLLRERHRDVLTIIAPRHPNRGGDVRRLASGEGLAVTQRSAHEPLAPATDVYLADTLGELGLFYRIAPIAFVGGSLVSHGGQNPIEPASLSVAILHGPHTENFEEIYQALDRSGAAVAVRDAAGLAGTVGAMISDPAALQRRRSEAAHTLKPFTGALEATMRSLSPYLAIPVVAVSVGQP
jgi:3-deoxy-D-manno-octulosonic-acid transferase